MKKEIKFNKKNKSINLYKIKHIIKNKNGKNEQRNKFYN